MDWHAMSEAAPEAGEEVLVYRHDDGGDIYAVAHIDEPDDGDPYWDSDSDIVHGCALEYVSHWCLLSPPAL